MTLFPDPIRERELRSIGIKADVVSDGHQALVMVDTIYLDRLIEQAFKNTSGHSDGSRMFPDDHDEICGCVPS